MGGKAPSTGNARLTLEGSLGPMLAQGWASGLLLGFPAAITLDRKSKVSQK